MQTKEIYKSYYTKSNSLVNYMIKMLQVEAGMYILEPCAGDGVFIDALIETQPNLSFDAYELNPEAISLLHAKYANYKNIRVKCADTVTDEELTTYSEFGGVYNRIIANPPYGGWQDYDKRKGLKKLYGNIYVKETYSLFLLRCIHLLNEHGKLVFIIPDTYLNLHTHTELRNCLLTSTKIVEIALFPSSFFPNVNFGYSNLSIITLEKLSNKLDCLNNEFKIFSGFDKPKDLEDTNKSKRIYSILQRDVYKNHRHVFFVSDTKTNMLLSSNSQTVGDIASCVTGIYSGNDKLYLRPISPTVKNSKKYTLLDKNLICHEYTGTSNLLDGISSPECFIPVVKGGAIKYLKPDNWYIDWSKNAVDIYKKDKKARFQNSSYYFKRGIGIPMVSSSQVTACLMENKLFDQSIVGVFPRDEKWTYYLLAFFNSPTCTKLLRAINPSANNSANYIKKIPFVAPSDEILSIIDSKVKEILLDLAQNRKYSQENEQIINNLIFDIYDK